MSDATFADHFSGHAADYSRYRPRYPAALFDWLASLPAATAHAWDCGTGNGQAAVALAERFDAVVATDASAPQVAQATPHPRVTYGVAPAEISGLPDASVDLILVAQALHWFDHARFWPEVRRVARPGAAFAAVSYTLCHVAPGIDEALTGFYAAVEEDWPLERQHVELGYTTIDFPFARIAPPALEMRARWDLEQLLGYLGTWSAVRRHRKRTGVDPLAPFAATLAELWGAGPRDVVWPMTLLAARITS